MFHVKHYAGGYMDIFFIVDKTNALLKATGWDTLTISMLHDALNMYITVKVHLNNDIIGETKLPDNVLTDDLYKQNKLVGKLHEFAVISYDTHINRRYTNVNYN